MSTAAIAVRHCTPRPLPMRTRSVPAQVMLPPHVIALHRPLWVRLAQATVAAWREQRLAAQRRRDERALATLPHHVLRDAGLAHLVPEQAGLRWSDYERARG